MRPALTHLSRCIAIVSNGQFSLVFASVRLITKITHKQSNFMKSNVKEFKKQNVSQWKRPTYFNSSMECQGIFLNAGLVRLICSKNFVKIKYNFEVTK